MAGRPKSREGRYERITLEVREDLLEWMDDQPDSRREIIEQALLAKKESEEMNATQIMAQTLENYLASKDFKEGVIASTKASWKGDSYSVELFPDGAWRNLWTEDIGNKYDSPGIILRIPTLSDEDHAQAERDGLDDEDFFDLAFANEEAELAQQLRDALSER